MKCKFMIAGHGRSGTHYMAELFGKLGHPVGDGHEVKNEGICHNYKSSPAQIGKIAPEYLIQVVRNPWDVIESSFRAHYSLAQQNSVHCQEIAKYKPNRLEFEMMSIVLWNRGIASCNPCLVVHVEEAPMEVMAWMKKNGITVPEKVELPKTNVNPRHASGWHLDKELPWDTVSDEVMAAFKEHCAIYGYPTERPA